MQRQVRRLGFSLLALFTLLLASVTYIQVVAADRIAENPANAFRQLVAEYKVDRGLIVARDQRTRLAFSKKGRGDLVYSRHYPQGELYSNITGYYSLVFLRSGLEQSYNPFLSAEAPELLAQTLADQVLGRPKRGATVVSTIDPKVQEAASRALGGRPGAVAAVDFATGDILALYSNPSFDPNQLSSQNRDQIVRAWRRLSRDPGKPLVPRATQELFPPGSTFKIVTASAALENGFGPESTWPGDTTLDLPLTTHDLQNFGGSSCGGQISLAEALRISCNVAFGAMGLKLGAGRLAEQARAFGFAPDASSGQIPFDDVPFEAGVFPDPSAFQDAPAAQAFSAIGQQDVRANPLQMALVAAAIANDGVLMRPRLVSEIRDRSGQIVTIFDPEVYSTPLSPTNARILTDMMVNVVDSGTGTEARIPGVLVAGKTGTAQTGVSGEAPHAWFTSFAQAEGRQVAVSVIVLGGGDASSEQTGGRVAAPIARAVMEAALKG